MDYMEMLGSGYQWLLTLSIFSYLYKDNPFYKAAEHLYIRVSAGYVAVISFCATDSTKSFWSSLAIYSSKVNEMI